MEKTVLGVKSCRRRAQNIGPQRATQNSEHFENPLKRQSFRKLSGCFPKMHAGDLSTQGDLSHQKAFKKIQKTVSRFSKALKMLSRYKAPRAGHSRCRHGVKHVLARQQTSRSCSRRLEATLNQATSTYGQVHYLDRHRLGYALSRYGQTEEAAWRRTRLPMTACRDGLMTCNTAKICLGQNLLERIICTGRVVDLSLQNPCCLLYTSPSPRD